MINFFKKEFKPLDCRLVEKALKNLGFTEKKKTGTSHRQFTKLNSGKLYHVTLDCHKGEVSALNIRSMIKQAGVTYDEFYNAIKS